MAILMFLPIVAALLLGSTCTGITDITLTTPHQGYYCPNTTAVLTCTASNTTALHWKANGQDITTVSSLGRVSTINNEAYTVTFINDSREYLTSTLQVAVDEIDAVTNISCLTRNKAKHHFIIRECKPSPPQNVTVGTNDFQKENFSIIVSWDALDDVQYVVSLNSTNSTEEVYTNMTNIVTLRGTYDTLLQITLEAINCAGRNEVTREVFCNSTRTYASDSPPPTVYPTINTTPSRTFSNGVTRILQSISTTTSVTPTRTQTSLSVIIGIPVAIVIVAGTVVVAIIGLAIFKKRSNFHRRKPLGTNKRSITSNEVVKSKGIDACYDVVRLGNITESSLNQNVLPTPLCGNVKAKTQSLQVDRNGEAAIDQEEDSCQLNTSQTSHRTISEIRPPTYYEDVPPIKQKTPQRFRLDTLETQEFNLSSKSSEATPPPKPPHTPTSYETSQPSVEQKHPLDEKITIDQVIQQLGKLIPQWEELGRAADIQPSVLKEIADHFKDPRDCFVEVINQVFIPNKTMWADLIALCDDAGFENMSSDLQEAYRTGVLPVKVEDKKEVSPQSRAAPPIPPRGFKKDTSDKDDATPPTLSILSSLKPNAHALPSPVVPEDDAPPLPPPLAPEDIPSSHSQPSGHRRLPPLPPNTERLPPARPPKAPKPSALTKL